MHPSRVGGIAMNTGAAAAPLVGFKRHLRAEVSAGNGAFLFSEHGVTVLRGSQIEALATLLDGTRNLEALLGAVPAGMAPEQVASLLAQLAEAGLVTARSPQVSSFDEHTVAYWEAGGVDAATAIAGAANSTVRLLTVGDIDEVTALATLRSAGLTAVYETDPSGSAADLSLVLCDDYLNPRLAEIDSAHRSAKA